MASKKKPTRKPKPLPLARSLHLIEEERVNIARRTRERISLLCIDSEEEPEYSVDKATQAEIPMREVHVEIENISEVHVSGKRGLFETAKCR